MTPRKFGHFLTPPPPPLSHTITKFSPSSPCDVTNPYHFCPHIEKIIFLYHFFLRNSGGTRVILQIFCSLLLSAFHPLDCFSSVDPMQNCMSSFFCQGTPSPKQYKTFCTTRVCPSLHKNKHSSRESKYTYVIYFLIKTNDTATSTNILF